MTKFIVGLLLGLSIGAAFADSMLGSGSVRCDSSGDPGTIWCDTNSRPAQQDTNGRLIPAFRVDANGYVICSDQRP